MVKWPAQDHEHDEVAEWAQVQFDPAGWDALAEGKEFDVKFRAPGSERESDNVLAQDATRNVLALDATRHVLAADTPRRITSATLCKPSRSHLGPMAGT